MHAQAGRGVHFDHAAVLLFERAQHVLADHVDAADVQADHLRRIDGARGHFGVHGVGDVGGGAAGREVGVVAQHHALAQLGHALGREALRLEPADGDVVQADLGERGGVALAAARVEVHGVDQLAHGGAAVANHLRRIAARGGHEAVAHHQQAEVEAGQEFLDHHLAVHGGRVVGRIQLLARGDVHRHALALVAVLRLDHDRQADFFRGGPAVVGAAHGAAQRHRHAGGVEQLLGEFLVLRDRFGHAAGAVDLGGLDAALLGAPAELHQAAAGEAAVWNAARHGGVDDGAGARAQALRFVEVAQLGDGGVGVEGGVGQRGLDQLFGQREGAAAHVFLGVLHGDLVHAFFGRGRGVAEVDGAAGLGLQRHGGVLEHVGQRQRLAEHHRMQLADGREAGAQAGFEPVELADGVLVAFAGHDGLDGGVAAPEIGAAQGADAGDFHGATARGARLR
ncbi:hypothetical protein D3C72_1170160 [compost metagenome]